VGRDFHRVRITESRSGEAPLHCDTMWRVQMIVIRKPLLPLLGLCLLLWAFNTSFSLGQQNSSSNHAKVTREPGRSTYNSACAGCHGLDGRGSDKAVNISESDKVRHLSDVQLSDIISNGVPGTGMPAFHSLSGTCGHSRERLRRKLCPAMQYAGKRFSSAKANAQVATRSPGKEVSLDPICLVTGQAPQARRFGKRSSGRRDYRPRATGRRCLLQARVIGLRA
jgi:hypothetical protein